MALESFPQPVAMRWNNEIMTPEGPGALALARAYYTPGTLYPMAEWPDRDWNSHKHYFAHLREMWENLPQVLRERWPSPIHLRKYALIATGWAVKREVVCASEIEAKAVAAFADGLHEYAVVVVKGNVVAVFVPMSQSARGMPGRHQFQRSKWDVLGWVADKLELAKDDPHRDPGD